MKPDWNAIEVHQKTCAILLAKPSNVSSKPMRISSTQTFRKWGLEVYGRVVRTFPSRHKVMDAALMLVCLERVRIVAPNGVRFAVVVLL